jgi:hypothetical protein
MTREILGLKKPFNPLPGVVAGPVMTQLPRSPRHTIHIAPVQGGQQNGATREFSILAAGINTRPLPMAPPLAARSRPDVTWEWVWRNRKAIHFLVVLFLCAKSLRSLP